MSAKQETEGAATSDTYCQKFGRDIESPTRRRLRREVYGDEYPEEARPRSFVTRSELRRVAAEIGVGPGQTFVDLGCGQAGPSLWVARQTGAALIGIDLSSYGIARAQEAAAELGLADRARLIVGDLTVTGLPDASLDGAMSIDVLWSVPDKAGALREAARILRPGARFAFTNWDRELSPPGYPPPLGDHRPLLEAAGLEVETYEVQPDAERLRRAYYERLVAAQVELAREMGEEGAEKLLVEPRATLGLVDGTDYLDHSRRIFVVARRRDSSV
jgi:ubiquinone/menaquinone biosynthesis C-methylase UbiE